MSWVNSVWLWKPSFSSWLTSQARIRMSLWSHCMIATGMSTEPSTCCWRAAQTLWVLALCEGLCCERRILVKSVPHWMLQSHQGKQWLETAAQLKLLWPGSMNMEHWNGCFEDGYHKRSDAMFKVTVMHEQGDKMAPVYQFSIECGCVQRYSTKQINH